MIDLLEMTLEEMRGFVQSLGEPKYRANQIYKEIYAGICDFREMTNLPESLRAYLSENARISLTEVLGVQESADGTRKLLLGLGDGSGSTAGNGGGSSGGRGNAIEAVFMEYKYGNSVCVSSQAGCRMGCRFCASTRNGLVRNLTAGEMVSQVLTAGRYGKVGHIVIMGTGEPFDNYENVAKFIDLVHAEEGLNISRRNITVSTCGVVPGIYDFARDFPQVNLAISLHAADDEKRSSIMPINRKYPIAEVMKAAKHYTEATGRRITFEYTMVSSVNDGKGDAERLIGLLRGLNCHVNIIPLNRVEGTGFDTVSRKRAEEFAAILEKSHIQVTVRRELGADIDAACGQLRLNMMNNSN